MLKYNEVVVENKEKDEFREIHPEYVYLTIPSKYVCVYHKLLVYMADFGKSIIDDCTSTCKGDSKNLISCWNLFQSALACYTLGNIKQADFFMEYIKKQLTNIYQGTSKKVFNESVPLAITPDGKLKAVVSCAESTKFFVDEKTGNLYEEYKASEGDNKVYTIEEDNLIAKENE